MNPALDTDRFPAGSFERLLCAVDFHHDKVREIAVLGDAADRRTEALIRVVYDRYIPNKVVVGANRPVEVYQQLRFLSPAEPPAPFR